MNFDGLSLEQKNIILNNEGPMLIIAGPGTGKTFTLIKKIIYLLIYKKIPPESILITTFTNKAANELKLRIAAELSKCGFIIDTSKLKIGTIHSIAMQIVDLKNFTILEDFEQKYFIYKNLNLFKKIEGFNYLESHINSSSGDLLSNLQKLFNILSENNTLPQILIESEHRLLRTLGLIYSTYLHILDKENILDFSQIQAKALKILTTDNALLKELHKEIQYIIIDEYQDINSIQNEILLTLCNENNNICVVGDDDQSIYRFRGAEVKNILNFSSYFPSNTCKIFTLSCNYRSPVDIVKFYSDFLNEDFLKNKRYSKNLTSNKVNPNNSIFKISDKMFPEVAKKTGIFIKELINKKIISDFSEITFLFRSTKTSEAKILSDEFANIGIPVFSPRSGKLFHKDEVMLILGLALSFYKQFSKTLYEKNSESALTYYEHYYKKCISKFSNYLDRDEGSLFKNENNEFKKWITTYEINEFTNFLDLFYESMKFKEIKELFFYDNSSSYFEKDKSKQIHNNISLILTIISNYEKRHKSIYKANFFLNYLPFLLQCKINEYEDSENLHLDGHISFLTFHQSKGLEFPIVFMGSLDYTPKQYEKNKVVDLLFSTIIKPEEYDFKQNELEDCYRIYYTGFSRAKEFLFLFSKDNREDLVSGYKTPSHIFEKVFDNLPPYTDFLESYMSYKLISSGPKNHKAVFSYTGDIALYDDCPIKYRFFRNLNFPKKQVASLNFGSLIHLTIEKLHNVYRKTKFIDMNLIKKVLRENYNSLKKNNGFILNPSEGEKAINIIMQYCSNDFENFKFIKESELNLTLVKENYILNGVLDILAISDNGFNIIDLKTNSGKPESIPENYRKQLLTYKYLAEKNGYNIENLMLYFLSDSSLDKIQISFTEEDVENNLNHFDIIINKIINEEFSNKTPHLNRCINCELKFYCSD